MVALEGQADLLEVVGALRARGRFTNLLHRGNQQGDEDRDDGDHHEQLNEREARFLG